MTAKKLNNPINLSKIIKKLNVVVEKFTFK